MNNIYNLDKLRKINNPMLVGAMTLLAKESSEANRKIFLDEIKRATLLVQLYITPPPALDEEGKPKLTPENKLNIPAINMNGKKFFAVYTDLGEVMPIKAEGQICIIPQDMKQIAHLLIQAKGDFDGIIMNPKNNGMVMDLASFVTISKYFGKEQADKEITE